MVLCPPGTSNAGKQVNMEALNSLGQGGGPDKVKSFCNHPMFTGGGGR